MPFCPALVPLHRRQNLYHLILAALVLCTVSPVRCSNDVDSIVGPNSCGIASLSMLTRLAKGDIYSSEPRLQVSPEGQSIKMSMLEIKGRAGDLGMDLTGVKCSLQELEQFPLPVIAHVKTDGDTGDHFLVVDRVTDSCVRVYDQQISPITYSREDFSAKYAGTVLAPAEAVTNPSGIRRPHVDKPIINVGKVPANSTVTGSFSLHVDGSAVEVLDSRTCCGTVIEPAGGGWRIEPGKECTVSMVCQAPSGGGRFDRTVSLLTNLAKWPVVSLTITGESVEPVAVLPQILNFGTVTRGTTSRRQLRLSNLTPDQARELSISCGADFIKLDVSKYDEKAADITCMVTLHTDKLRGLVKERICVAVGSGVTLEVPLYGCVAADLSVAPHQFMLGLIPKDRLSSSKVKLYHSKKQGFAITAIEAPPGVAVRYTKVDNGYALEASIKPDADFELLDGFVTVTTSIAGDSTVLIPIFAASEPE